VAARSRAHQSTRITVAPLTSCAGMMVRRKFLGIGLRPRFVAVVGMVWETRLVDGAPVPGLRRPFFRLVGRRGRAARGGRCTLAMPRSREGGRVGVPAGNGGRSNALRWLELSLGVVLGGVAKKRAQGFEGRSGGPVQRKGNLGVF